MKATKHQMMAGDYAVFHSDMNSGMVRITSVSESGYEYVHLPSCVGNMMTRPLDSDRLEACPSLDAVRMLRRAWLKRHPEVVAEGRTDFYKHAFDDAGISV